MSPIQCQTIFCCQQPGYAVQLKSMNKAVTDGYNNVAVRRIVFRDLKAYCTRTGLKMTHVVAEAISEWLRKRKRSERTR